MSAQNRQSTEAESSAANLEELARRVAYEIDCLRYPTQDWVPPIHRAGGHVYDAVIVGGGQSGVAIAFGLMRERVSNVLVIDRKAAGREGPWLDFARMHTLRTPKTVTGPDLGIPSLSPRAWYEARFGAEAWRRLGKIPREDWHDYLSFVRAATGLPVENETEVYDIEPRSDGLLWVHTRGRHDPHHTSRRLMTRRIVLATGMEGSGRWHVPRVISDYLPPDRYAGTSEPIDFAGLGGKRIAVIGAGASAFDNAAEALAHGADRVDLFVRRKQIPTVNPYRWMEKTGFLRHFGDLDDDKKWQFMRTIFGMNQPPPQDAFNRCTQFENFAIKLDSPLEGVGFADKRIRVRTTAGTADYDFLIVGTGLTVDLAGRPELRRIAPDIALWRDRYVPQDGDADPVLAGYPYLGRNFEFVEKVQGRAPYLKHIYSYTFGSMPSLASSAGISNLKFGVERVVRGITRSLFVEDAELHLRSLKSYGEVELDTADAGASKDARMPGMRSSR
jgi:FAD-dependent urate hydroxylase